MIVTRSAHIGVFRPWLGRGRDCRVAVPSGTIPARPGKASDKGATRWNSGRAFRHGLPDAGFWEARRAGAGGDRVP
ncbi:hypothetical protein GCM10010519_13050 [Streptomyces lactacystinicus]